MIGQSVVPNIDNMDPLAIVRFTPSLDNPEASFADEIYYPPEEDEDDEGVEYAEYVPEEPEMLDRNLIKPVLDENSVSQYYQPDPEEPTFDFPENFQVRKKSYPEDFFAEDTSDDLAFMPAMHRRSLYNPARYNFKERDMEIFDNEIPSGVGLNPSEYDNNILEVAEVPDTETSLNNLILMARLQNSYENRLTEEEQEAIRNRIALIQEDINSAGDPKPISEPIDGYDDEMQESRIYYDDPESALIERLADEIAKKQYLTKKDPGIYTEGGVVHLPNLGKFPIFLRSFN